jgi:hypothetical protein
MLGLAELVDKVFSWDVVEEDNQVGDAKKSLRRSRSVEVCLVKDDLSVHNSFTFRTQCHHNVNSLDLLLTPLW